MRDKTAAEPYELYEVQSLEVVCDGGGGPLGHPRVFLHIDQDKGDIICPYCSRKYILRILGARAGGH